MPTEPKKAALVMADDAARTASLVIESHNANTIDVWDLALSREGTDEIGVAKAVETFNADGDRCSHSLRHGVVAKRVDRDISASISVVAAVMTAELGVVYETELLSYREFFVKGERLSGILLIECVGDICRASLTKSLLPAILKPGNSADVLHESVVVGKGSSLPASLECVVRTEHRYWEKEGDEIAKVHSALLDSNFFTEDNIRIVNGELRRVVTKTYLYEPAEEVESDGKPRPKVRKRIDTVLGNTKDFAIVSPPDGDDTWGDTITDCTDDIEKDIAIVVTDSRENADVAALVAAVAKVDNDFLVGVLNTDTNAQALAKVSTPFLIDGDQEIIWAYSGAVAKAKNVSFVAIADKVADSAPAADPDIVEHAITKTIMPADGDVEERFVLGIVLEPETVDAQDDIYSAAEVRQSAHRFMEQFQNIGLMHNKVVNEHVKILESYLAPDDFEMGGVSVKKGTWLLAVRVLDDELWVEIKEGGLTGFSIGGSAVRVPERPDLPST